MTFPPVSAENWWEPTCRNALPSDCQLEEALDWPQKTLAFLRDAFEKGLGRANGWRIQQAEFPEAARLAASVFRRGVDVGESLKESSGAYSINRVSYAELKKKSVAKVVDHNVAAKWPELVNSSDLIVETSEIKKDLSTLAKINRWLKTNNDAAFVSLGGGVLGDVAAFAASLVGREIIFAPTTLLSAVDACVGGKTGVNFAPYGKNQLGHFYFPSSVIICDDLFGSLTDREFNSGRAECFKHGLLCGNQNLVELSLHKDRNAVCARLFDFVEIKAGVVAQDAAETGIRASLNLGHTIGHAIEAMCHQRRPEDYLLHGEAVFLGMLAALHLSQLKAGFRDKVRNKLFQQVSDAGVLPKNISTYLDALYSSDEMFEVELLRLIKQDKKASAHVNFVLLSDVGKVYAEPKCLTPVSDEEILQSWRIVKGHLKSCVD